jgi:hypothetical protein
MVRDKAALALALILAVTFGVAAPLGQGAGSAPDLTRLLPFPSERLLLMVAEEAGTGTSLAALRRGTEEIARRLGLRRAVPEAEGGRLVRWVRLRSGAVAVVGESVSLAPVAGGQTLYVVDEGGEARGGGAGLTRLLLALPGLPGATVLTLAAVEATLHHGPRRSRALLRRLMRRLSVEGGASVPAGREAWLGSGRAPDLPAPILVGGRAVNVQILVAYDRKRRETDVWLGTPLLPADVVAAAGRLR